MYTPPPGPQGYNPYQTPAQSGKAVASLVLGICSIMCCAGILTGLPAIVLGFMGRKDVLKSEGALDGSGLAVAGIVTGMIGTLGSLAYGVIWAFTLFATSTSPVSPYTPPPAYTTPASPYLPSTGKVHVLQLRAADGSLKAQIAKQASDAVSRGERAMIMTVSPTCAACSEIAGTFSAFEMQLSLGKVTVVKVDVTEFTSELGAAGLEKGKSLPWFFLVDSTGKVVDSISADEWDDNKPENIAPVMDEFLDGTLSKKHPPPPNPYAP
jgi:hypothetical protein